MQHQSLWVLTSSQIRLTSQRHTNAHNRLGEPSLSLSNPSSETKERATLTDKHHLTHTPPAPLKTPVCLLMSTDWGHCFDYREKVKWDYFADVHSTHIRGLKVLSIVLSLFLTFSEHLCGLFFFVLFLSCLRIWAERVGGGWASQQVFFFFPFDDKR